MSIRIETARNGHPRYDIVTMGPAGRIRERRNFRTALTSPSARMRWAQAREAHLTRFGREVREVHAPTLQEFADRWMCEYVRLKPSTAATYDNHLRLSLIPVLGQVRLTDIG